MTTLSREDAAKMCGVGIALFDKEVRPHLQEIKIGRRVVFLPRDVQTWLERDKAGESDDAPKVASGTCASLATVTYVNDPRVQEIAKRLAEKRHASTRTPSLAKSPSKSSVDESATNRSRLT